MLGTSLQKRLRIESLEEKVPLAGDVAVSVVGGDLVITGDAAANSIILEEGLFDGHQFRILGRDQTTVNGVLNEWVFFNNVTRDVLVNMGGGADTFRAYGFPTVDNSQPLDIPRDLIINMGSGDDHIALGVTEEEEFGNTSFFIQSPVKVGRDLTINTGAGTDSTLLSAVTVGDDLSITDTGGNTEIGVWPSFLWQQFPVDMTVAGDLNVNLGSGDDFVDFTVTTVGGDVTYGLGSGNDFASMLSFSAGGSFLVNAGAGANEVRIEDGTVGGGVLMSGNGANNFQIANLSVASSIVMLTSSGDDQLFITNSSSGSAVITSGAGADYVQLVDSAFALLTVSLGAGSDTLSMDGVTSILAILLGGGGSDTLQESADNSFLLAIDSSFELFETI